ncbi:MAG: exodeoxyribonuclease VII large subunit [Thermoanaerobaculia bacterium]
MVSSAARSPAPPRPYTVSELLAEVGSVLRSSWRDVSVAGEIGVWNVNASSGHCYFTLKDKASALDAVMFASDLRRLRFRPEPGLEVVVRGTLDLYVPRGRFQVRVSGIEPVGAGALQLAFEQLKKRLEAEGLFDPARKRPLPRLPRRIAIVTSPTGAALRDVLHILRRRFDGLALTIYPVRVQGEAAAAEIAQALRALNRRGGFDVLILARGGGSAEDLACFNDERVARALAASRILTISAVGHETDWTIADFVADLRAPTPSAAAEIVVERKDELARRVADGRMRLMRTSRSRLDLERARLKGLSRDEGLLRLRWKLREWLERVGQGRDALVEALGRRPVEFATRLAAARRRLEGFSRLVGLAHKRESSGRLRSLLAERSGRNLERKRARLADLSGRLELVSPLAVLARGYAVAYREGSASPLLSASTVRPGERIRVRLHEGELKAVVDREPEDR